jgi:PAS domain S-box-containing protein
MANEYSIGEQQSPEAAARSAAKAARLAAEACDLAKRAEIAARFAEKITLVGSAVAREFGLPAVLDVVLEQAVKILEARFVQIHLVDEGRRALKLAGQRNLPDDLIEKISDLSFDDSALAARTASSGHVQIVSSIEELDPVLEIDHYVLLRTGCKTAVALPLFARGDLLGVLTFALAEPHKFTPEERAALDNCAEIFSISIAHASIFERERQVRALFEAVGHAAVAIASELELAPALQEIVDKARDVVDAEFAALGIVNPEGRAFTPWVFSGMTKEEADRIGRHPEPVATLALVALSGCLVREPDIRQHPLYQGIPDHHPVITSFLAVPIFNKELPVGNLYLGNKRGAAEFTKEDQRAIELLAAHAGAAVRQAFLREELQLEHARFKAIVQYAPHGVAFVEADTMKVVANRRAIEILGRPLPMEIPEKVEYEGDLYTPDGQQLSDADRPSRRAMRGETVPPQELIVHRRDGIEVPVLVSVSPVIESGTTKGVVVVFENISVLKELQRLREEWAAIVTHDLRQPLNILTMHLHLLRQMAASPSPEKLHKAAEQMQKATANLNRMVTDLAEASRIETKRLTLERRSVDLESLVRDVVQRQLALAPSREVVVHAAGPIPKIEVDSLRIEQVLNNLLSNALKYSYSGTPVDIQLQIANDEVQVIVANRGPGITPGDLHKLFDRYYRTSRARASMVGGQGLGLYIAKGLIEAHGGRIWAESIPGEITTFQFGLPVPVKPAA